MAAPPAPPSPSKGTSIGLAASLGRIAFTCLIIENFLLIFAPLFLLLELSRVVDVQDAGGILFAFLSEPGMVLSVADLFSVIGFVIFAFVLFLFLVGLTRNKKVSGPTLFLGVIAFALVVALVPVKVYAEAQARGALGTVDTVAATGGWTVASGLLLAATIVYLFFTMGLENGTKSRHLTTFKWPIYAAVNVLGSLAVAGFFQGAAASGAGSMEAFTLGLVLKVTLIPVLGVMAYRDLLDRLPWWPYKLGVAPAPPPTPVRRAIFRPRPRRALPVPPPPPDLPLPPPPPPDDWMPSPRASKPFSPVSDRRL